MCSNSVCPNDPLENDQLVQRILPKFLVPALWLWKYILVLKLKQRKDLIMKIGQQMSWIKVDFLKRKKKLRRSKRKCVDNF